MDELLQKVGNSQVLSKLDLAKGFYQIGLTEEARARSAFVTPMGKFEFLRMPFGMRNAPSTFQRLMDIVLEWKESFRTLYIDDTLVYSSTGAEHIGHVNEVSRSVTAEWPNSEAIKVCVWDGDSGVLGTQDW